MRLTVPRSDTLVELDLDGPGRSVTVGNCDASSHERFHAKQQKADNGLCRMIVGPPTTRIDRITRQPAAADGDERTSHRSGCRPVGLR